MPKGAPGDLERDFGHGHEVTGHGEMASHCQGAGLDVRNILNRFGGYCIQGE